VRLVERASSIRRDPVTLDSCMSMYKALVPQVSRMLGNLDSSISLAMSGSEQGRGGVGNDWGPPDLSDLARSVVACCEVAARGAATLAGRAGPPSDCGASSFEQLRACITATRQFLEDVEEGHFQNAKRVVVSLPSHDGKSLSGPDYLNQYVLPSFYFHVAAAYVALRRCGVPVGLDQYLGAMNWCGTHPV